MPVERVMKKYKVEKKQQVYDKRFALTTKLKAAGLTLDDVNNLPTAPAKMGAPKKSAKKAAAKKASAPGEAAPKKAAPKKAKAAKAVAAADDEESLFFTIEETPPPMPAANRTEEKERALEKVDKLVADTKIGQAFLIPKVRKVAVRKHLTDNYPEQHFKMYAVTDNDNIIRVYKVKPPQK